MYKLETKQLVKVYPGTVALKDFTARFEGGKVHAIIGKNGSGKSTLIKIISGAVDPTEGRVIIDGAAVSFHSPSDAFRKGLATVYQELSLIPELSIAENIFMGRLFKKNFPSFRIDWEKTFQKAQELLNDMGIRISPRRKVRTLSVGQQQIIEIVKAMSFDPAVLMLDEPTSALAKHEVKTLFSLLKKLKSKGVAVLYITHRLDELYDIADSVTVLRDGMNAGRIAIQDATPQKIVHMMFGEVDHQVRPKDLSVGDHDILRIQNLTQKPHFEDISFSVKEGEILGIAGMMGSGRTELLRAVFGADSFESGKILFHGENIENPSPMAMKMRGMAMVPENRKEEGLILKLSIRDNLCYGSLKKIAPKGYISRKIEQPFVDRQITDLQIKTADDTFLVSSLSGGNQQKVVIGNWLNTEPNLVIFDEPSRGIDVNAKQQIFQIMWNLSRKQISSLMVSSELEELLEVCHRILVMRHGRIVGEVKPQDITLDQLYAMCMGA